MVIGNFNALRIAFAPFETDPPAAVDADAVLALAIGLEFLEPVARQGRKSAKIIRGIEHVKLSKRLPLDCAKSSHRLSIKKAFSVRIAEGLNHGDYSILLYVKRQSE